MDAVIRYIPGILGEAGYGVSKKDIPATSAAT